VVAQPELDGDVKNQDVALVGMKAKPYVSIVPGVLGGSPCLNNTRLPVEALASFWWRGASVEEIERAYPYPYVSAAAIRVSCWFLRDYGGRKWRGRFKSWKVDGYSLYKDDCPMPPREEFGI
jgi:uncharacterized protein (DUF433 family)